MRERNPLGYNFSGFVIGTNYQLNKIPLFKNISSESYFLSIEIGHSTLSEDLKVYTRNGSMQTVKVGYRLSNLHLYYYSVSN